MNFSLKVMGSASAMPVSGRLQSAQVLNVHGRLFLIDCGEGVQQQMIRFGVPMMKLETLLISHIHGDHVFGIFGLLSTLGMKGRTQPLDIYAPASFGPILKFFLSYYGEGLAYEIRFTPVSANEPVSLYSTKGFEILALPLNHKIETYGYIFREKEPMLNIRKEAVTRLGLTLTEIATLKRGEDVLRPAGADNDATFLNGFVKCSGTDRDQLIAAKDVTYKPYEPKGFAYVSDTAPFPQLTRWLEGVTTLYHEATYLAALGDQAEKRHHSTTVQAAVCARAIGAEKLLIGHYSSRCGDIALYEKECRIVFPETYAVSDGDSFEI